MVGTVYQFKANRLSTQNPPLLLILPPPLIIIKIGHLLPLFHVCVGGRLSEWARLIPSAS